MKHLFLMALTVILFTACGSEDKRYTQQSPEIETVKQHIENYNTKNYDTSILADTCKSFFNSKDNPILVKDLIGYHKANDENYASRRFNPEGQEFEMVVTDKGDTWVNCWLDWEATMKGNGKKIEMPIHLTYKFVDGKIVREYGYWDPTEVVLNLQAIEAENNMSVSDQEKKAAMDAIVKAWNANDKEAMAANMTDNFIRTENGTVIASSPSEYGTNLMDVFFGSFPDFQVILDDYKIIGNEFHINWTCKGTNTKPFQGNPATNKAIETHGHSVWTLESNGKFSREDAFYDNLTLFNQLGYSAPSLN